MTRPPRDPRIRPASPADIDACVEMAQRFLEVGPYRGLVTPSAPHQAQLLEYLLEHGGLFVCDAETTRDAPLVGMIGFSLVPLPMSGELTASELVWWIEPAARGSGCGAQLFDAGEQWASARDAIWIQMVAPFGADDVARRYLARGYVPMETIFQKRLKLAA